MLAGSDLLGGLSRRRRRWILVPAVVLVAAAVLAVVAVVGEWPTVVYAPLDRSGGPGLPPALQSDSPSRPIAAVRSTPEAPAALPAAPAETARVDSRAIESWLSAIANEAGLGLVIGPGIAGAEVTAAFPADVGWRPRLDALARVHGLAVRTSDGLLEVEEAAAPVPPAASAREQPPPAAAAPVVASSTAVLRLANARATDLASALEKPLGGGGVSAGVDSATNAIVFGGPQAAVEDALRLARALDVPRRRFLLEAHIVELSRSARSEMGVQWTLESNDLGGIVDLPAADSPGEGAGILIATSGSHSLRARLSALESSGRVRVISRPRVVVLEGKAASIEAVRILRVRLPDRGAVVSDADAGVAIDSGRAFEEIPVGVTLSVEPSLQGDGNVVLRITAKSSTLGPPQPPDDIPEELSRRVEAEVAVADGHTAVLGGLLREGRSHSGTGVPLLRSLPIVGGLFGKNSSNRDIEELVVLVTPHLVG